MARNPHALETPARQHSWASRLAALTTMTAGWLGSRGMSGQAAGARSDALVRHDYLTGLLNRRCFCEEAAQLIAAHGTATILLLDLDKFRQINDALGHRIGDRALFAISRRLRQACAGAHLVARFAGDEFVLLLPGIDNPRAAYAAAAQVRACFRDSFDAGGTALRIDTSIGVAVAPHHGARVEDLLIAADLALAEAKHRGGGAIGFFEPHLRERITARHAMQDALRLALDRGEFELLYQPQVNLATGATVGVEALLRWNHPRHGLLPPAQFLPALEEMPIASDVGTWVLRTAIAQAAQWRRRGLRIRVGVNLFASQFHACDLTRQVGDLLDQFGLPPELLELELTETVAISHCQTVKAAVEALHGRGVGIALDDFGTGYASLNLLKKLTFSRLKIDKSFVADMQPDSYDTFLVEMIVRLARTLKMQVIAEGVETSAQERWLIEAGCQEGQGYRYGKPMPASGIAPQASARRGRADAQRERVYALTAESAEAMAG